MGTIATFEGPTGPVTEIDPRIRARRIAVQRDEGRKRLRKLALAGGVVGLLALLGGSALWRSRRRHREIPREDYASVPLVVDRLV